MGGCAFGSEHESCNRVLLIFLQELQEFLMNLFYNEFLRIFTK